MTERSTERTLALTAELFATGEFDRREIIALSCIAVSDPTRF